MRGVENRLLMKMIKILFLLGFAAYIFVKAAHPDEFNLLDGANLLFHEAGHPVFGLFGEKIGIWGGTIMQLLMPALFAGYFFYHGNFYSASVILCWFGQNFFHIARYINDARAQALPLVGGGEHDWNRLLFDMHVLRYDHEIARVVWFLGLAIILVSVFLGIRFSSSEAQEGA